ncbi:MAG: porin [Pseudomonadota bacterium]
MKKTLIPAALLAALPSVVLADTTVYGRAHLSVDAYSGTVDGHDVGVSSNSSRLGFKGQETIGKDLAALWQIETTVDMTDAASAFTSPRNTFAGLKGGFGTLVAGIHDTPMKSMSTAYNLFNDQVGDVRNLLHYAKQTGFKGSTIGFDGRFKNTLLYVAPKMGGLTASAAYSTDIDSAAQCETKDSAGKCAFVGSNDDNNNDGYSLSAGYTLGGFHIDAAYEAHNADTSKLAAISGFSRADSESLWRAGLGYKTKDFRVFGFVEQSQDLGFVDGQKRMDWSLGASYAMGSHMLKAQYTQAGKLEQPAGDVADSEAAMLAVGYDYKLSKQTTLLVAYAKSMNGDNATFTPWSYAHGDNPVLEAGAGKDGGVFSVGLMHNF